MAYTGKGSIIHAFTFKLNKATHNQVVWNFFGAKRINAQMRVEYGSIVICANIYVCMHRVCMVIQVSLALSNQSSITHV